MPPTSAVGKGEIPGSSPSGSGKAGECGVTLQYIAWAAAVADFIAYVESGPLLVAIQKLARITTCVTGQCWRERRRKQRRID